MHSENTPLRVKCPCCGKNVDWTENFPFRPFCSKRCQLIDLGEWAAEEKSIPDKSSFSSNDNE